MTPLIKGLANSLKLYAVAFVADMGVQTSTLNAETAKQSGGVPDKKQIQVSDAFGYSKRQPTAWVKC